MLRLYEYGDMKNADNYDRTISILGYIYCACYMLANFYAYYCFYCSYIDYRWHMFIAHELICLLAIEWMWHNTQRIHNVDEARDSCFPAFRRPEAKPWTKWMLYPGALSGLMTYRIWSVAITLVLTASVSNIVLFGYK